MNKDNEGNEDGRGSFQLRALIDGARASALAYAIHGDLQT